MSVTDKPVLNTQGNQIGVADVPPYLVLASEQVLEARPELHPYRVTAGPRYGVWGGNDPPPVYLEFPTTQALLQVAGDPWNLEDRIESADWTGISERLARDPAKVALIREKVLELDRLLEALHLSNSETAAAKDCTAKLVELVSQPQPRWKEIAHIQWNPFLQGVYGSLAVEAAALALRNILL